MGQQNHHPEPCLISYGGVTCFPPPFNSHTILPPPGNRTTFDPSYLPENHGQVPYMITHYNGEHCNTFMLPSPSASVLPVPVNHDHLLLSNSNQIFEMNRSLFMDGSNRVFKRSGSSVAFPMTSEVHSSGHLVHGSQLVQAVPTPWLDQHSGIGCFSWNHAHGVPYLQDIAFHGYQVAATSRNSLAFMHTLPMRPHQGPHDVYHPSLPPPPMSPLQPLSMDIHLQLPSTSHRHSSSTLTTHSVQNDANPRPGFVSPTMPHGVMVYEASRQPLMIDLIARHYSFPYLRVLPVEEQGEQFGNKNSRLSDDFSSDHVKTRIFTSSAPLPADEEPNLCVICQMDFEDQEKIRVLDCQHEYHVECIKKWLTVKNNCPICKSTAFN